MTTLEILTTARALVAAGWTQGCNARDVNGKSVDATDPSAVCFCVAGAIWRVTGSNQNPELVGLLQEQMFGPGNWYTLGIWNDERGRTQGDAVLLFDRAIAAEKARAA